MLKKEQEGTTHCMRTIRSTYFKSTEIINTHKLAHAFFTEQITVLRVILSIAAAAMYFEGAFGENIRGDDMPGCSLALEKVAISVASI